MKGSPFQGTGSGSNQVTGDGAIAHFKENTGPAGKNGPQTSHPKPGGSTQGPSGDIGNASVWKP